MEYEGGRRIIHGLFPTRASARSFLGRLAVNRGQSDRFVCKPRADGVIVVFYRNLPGVIRSLMYASPVNKGGVLR